MPRFTATAHKRGLTFAKAGDDAKPKAISWLNIVIALAQHANVDSIQIEGIGVMPMGVLIKLAREATVEQFVKT